MVHVFLLWASLHIFTLPVERCNTLHSQICLPSVKVMPLTAPSSFVTHQKIPPRCVPPIRHERPSAAGTRFATRQYIMCLSPATLLLLSHHFWRLQIRNVALFNTTLLHPACTASSWCRDSSCELTFATFGEDRSQLSTRFYFPSPGLLRRPATVFDPRTVAELFL